MDATGGEGFLGLGADAEVGVSFGVEDLAVFSDDVGSGNWETPALFAVNEGEIDEDGEVVVAVVFGDGVDKAELLSDGVAGVGEHREGEAVLADHEVTLAFSLWRNCDEECAGFAELAMENAPSLEFCNAVGTPAAAEELDDERAQGEEIAGADELSA